MIQHWLPLIIGNNLTCTPFSWSKKFHNQTIKFIFQSTRYAFIYDIKSLRNIFLVSFFAIVSHNSPKKKLYILKKKCIFRYNRNSTGGFSQNVWLLYSTSVYFVHLPVVGGNFLIRMQLFDFELEEDPMKSRNVQIKPQRETL